MVILLCQFLASLQLGRRQLAHHRELWVGEGAESGGGVRGWGQGEGAESGGGVSRH